jgi:thiol-disulfide isomerase/thioredoxin
MRLLFTVILLCSSFAATAQKLKFKVTGQKDTTVHLVKYYGKGLYYADTAKMVKGVVTFDGKKQKPGIMALLLPGQKYFEFVYNKEEIDISTDMSDFVANMKVNKSEENKIFQGFVKYIGEKKTTASNKSKELEKLAKTDANYSILKKEIEEISKEVLGYQNNIIATHPNMLSAKIIKMSMDVPLAESPKDANGKITDSTFVYRHFRDHYWDNVDLKNDFLVNTPIFHNKLDNYFSKNVLLQHPDTIVKYAFKLIDPMDPKSETFKYCVSHVTSTFEKSQIMGMDKVFVKMGLKYYAAKNSEGKPVCHWMAEDKLEALVKKAKTNERLVQGEIPPNIRLRDTTDITWRDYYSLKSDYTILYFWEASCGHCKKTTPKLETLYSKKFKERNIEIFAVSKAAGDDFELWKKFIKDNKLTFINVAMTKSLYEQATKDASVYVPKFTTIESLNYHTTFDIMTTPRVFVLDKDKKIIAKSLSIGQLEEFLDRLQGREKEVKLFPVEEEKKEEKHDEEKELKEKEDQEKKTKEQNK